jgi:hypothetical protein
LVVFALAIDPATPVIFNGGMDGGGVFTFQRGEYGIYLPLIIK